jgi:hypothetical protein
VRENEWTLAGLGVAADLGVSILSEVGVLVVQELEQKPILSRLGDSRLSSHGDGDHRLMIDVRVILVQLCRQALGLLLLKELLPGSDLSTYGGLPKDSVRFHKTIRAFRSMGCAMHRVLTLQFGLMRPKTGQLGKVWVKMEEKRPQWFDRRAARVEARQPPLCSF